MEWVVSSPVAQRETGQAASVRFPAKSQVFHCPQEKYHIGILQKFWYVEEVHPACSLLKPEEQQVEDIFFNTPIRKYDGRYSVSLPLKGRPLPIAIETKNTALRTYNSMRQKFLSSLLVEKYTHFMEQYEGLKHMEQMLVEELHNPDAWYLPHHLVGNMRGNRKLRVVFDVSGKTVKHPCPICFLLPGLALREDLFTILATWR